MRENAVKRQAYDHPSYDPKRAKRLKVAAKRKAKMTFNSPGEQADYERLLRSNPKNDGLYGYPRQMLFPPSHIKALSIADIPEPTREERKRIAEQKKILDSVKDSTQPCWFCESETPHQEWKGQPKFCKRCGNTDRKGAPHE